MLGERSPDPGRAAARTKTYPSLAGGDSLRSQGTGIAWTAAGVR